MRTGVPYAVIAAVSLLVAGVLVSCNPAPLVTPSPTPISPVDARIGATLSFIDTKTNLGDPEYDLLVKITTNLPVSVQVDTFVDLNTACGVDRGCWNQAALAGQQLGGDVVKIDPGHWGQVTLTTLDGKPWPSGRYQVFLHVQSYWTLFEPQDPAYTKWVGGDTGPRLAGNPQAVQDPDHPAVLNLAAVATISR